MASEITNEMVEAAKGAIRLFTRRLPGSYEQSPLDYIATHDAEAMAHAALTAALAVQARTHVVVPREPTEAMLDAATIGQRSESQDAEIITMWECMLASTETSHPDTLRTTATGGHLAPGFDDPAASTENSHGTD